MGVLDKMKKLKKKTSTSSTPEVKKETPKRTQYILSKTDTLEYLQQLIKAKKKIPKKEQHFFSNFRSIYGEKYTGQKWLSVLIVHPLSLTRSFSNVSPKKVFENELKQFVREYILIKKFDREPTFIIQSALKNDEYMERIKKSY